MLIRNSSLSLVFSRRSFTKSMASIGFMSARYLRRIHMRSSVCLVEQQVVAAGAGGNDVDSREDTLVAQVAVELQLHVTRTLEFFEDNLVHLRAGVNQGSGDDGQ